MAEAVLQPGDEHARPALEQAHVLRDAPEQEADLRQDDRVEKEEEQECRGEHGDDHRDGREAARQAGPGQPRGRRVEHVSDAGGRHERHQDGGEQLQGEPGRHREADQQGDSLAARRLPSQPGRRGRHRLARPRKLRGLGERRLGERRGDLVHLTRAAFHT